MTIMKFNILLLNGNTKFFILQVKMLVIPVQMDLDDVLLGSDKILSPWTLEEKQHKDRKTLSKYDDQVTP